MADKTIGKISLSNIVSEFSDDERKLIINTVIDDYDADIKSRTNWEEKRDRYYKLWACERDPKNTPWQGASNICIPMLASAANQFHARAYQSIMAAPGMVKTVPVGAADIQKALNVERFLNWQIIYDMPEYEDVFDRTLQLLPINGVAVKKLNWNIENETPESHFISVTDFIIPYKTKSLKTARRMTHRVSLHADEIEERIDDGFYDEIEENELNAGPSDLPNSNPAIKKSGEDIAGEKPIRKTDEPFTILEQHRYWKIDGKRRAVIFWVIEDTRQLVRAVIREYKLPNKKKPITLNYFIDYHFIPNPEGWYSLGWGHFLEVLNEMSNTAFNQIFDGGSMSNKPFGFYSRRSGFRSRKIKIEPGGMYEVEDASGVFFPSMQRIDNTLFMVLGLIQQFAEQFTSATELLSGRQQKGVKTPTATGTLAVIEQGLVTFAVLLKRVLRSVRSELQLISLLNQLHMPDTKQYRVMEDSEKIAFPEVKREDFEGVYDVLPTGDPSFSSRSMRRQEAIELYQILMQNPLIANNEGAVYELTSDLIDAYGKQNKSLILPDRPPILDSPAMEHAKIAQGDFSVTAKPGEDHLAHLKAHTLFMGSDLANSLPKDYRDFLNKHLEQTKMVAMTEIQQEEQLGRTADQSPGNSVENPGNENQKNLQPNPMGQKLPSLETPGGEL